MEKKDPCAADIIYDSWSDYLRTNTRDDRFQLIREENTNYGYRRNVWGFRPVGIVASMIGCIICSLRLYLIYEQNDQLDLLGGIAGTYCLVLLILWVCHFTGDWVRLAAESYADRLVEAIEIL